MCGITGFSTAKSKPSNLLKRMNALLQHRGPDAEGYFKEPGINLAHKRLSILDLSENGAQPMEREHHVIIFNGEIYNFQELKEDLLKKGYQFKGQSDTEVLLNLFIEYGEECLKKLNGMFAFAIWNRKSQELFIARDRLGIKPLFYSFQNQELAFSSEIKSILAFLEQKPALNHKVLNSYFQYRYILGEETFFQGIFSLPAGHFLKFDNKTRELKIQQYWNLEACSNKEDLGEEYYLEKAKELLDKAIKMRMISDVPIGAYLSGGLDSSIIAAIMAQTSPNLQTFTIGFEEEGFNEFKFARLVAEKYKTKHHEILLSPNNYFDQLQKLIAFKDAPLSVPNEIPLYLMSKELKKYITVVLSGEGADELFGGYGRIFISYLEFQNKGGDNFLDFFLQKYKYVSDEKLAHFLSKESLSTVKSQNYTDQIFKKTFAEAQNLDIKDQAPFLFQKLHLQGLLQRVDTTTMATSVEARVPFVDHQLIEFVNRIPFHHKIRWTSDAARTKALEEKLSAKDISENYDNTKYILRKSYQSLLPKEIIERKKIGFPVPLDNWFHGKFQDFARNILQSTRSLERGVFNKDYINSGKYLEELSGINIWMMINLELFLQQYFD